MRINKLAGKQLAAEKKKEHAVTGFATQLAQAQALVPQVPMPAMKHGAHVHKPAAHKSEAKISAPERQRLPELPAASKEKSAQPATLFILPETPREVMATKIEAPPPVWAPKELLADDTARLTINPHTVNFINEGQQMSLQIKNGEVSIRAQGELAASLKSSEAELRIALAQEGLKLRETDSTSHQKNDDATSDERRHEQHRKTEGEDEWT